MAYRNKTFISFASEDIISYRLMTAWKNNKHIDFNFYDAHDLNTARDTSLPETIKRRLRERLSSAKQIVLLIGDVTKAKANRPSSFINYEVDVIKSLGLPIVLVNINGSRSIQRDRIPDQLKNLYTVSVSLQPKIIQHALDNYVDHFNKNIDINGYQKLNGPRYYEESVYQRLGL